MASSLNHHGTEPPHCSIGHKPPPFSHDRVIDARRCSEDGTDIEVNRLFQDTSSTATIGGTGHDRTS